MTKVADFSLKNTKKGAPLDYGTPFFWGSRGQLLLN